MRPIDWAIMIIPMIAIMGVAAHVRRYVHGVADFLSAGRLCGRYVISVADVANGLSIITLVAFVEVYYKIGFAMTFWNNLLIPLGLVLSLTGFCVYRFRETKAMSLGQFLEMRYSRSLRIFAAVLRTTSEILTNMICPAIAARFFIHFLGLPFTVSVFGHPVPTFMLLMAVFLTLAVSIICLGGTLALVVTDTIQGLLCYPMMTLFSIFILVKFSWSGHLAPVMTDRVAHESFINPYDISELRDFNAFTLLVALFVSVLHRASWIGAGNTAAAKSPHEQKMANILGTWRTGFSGVLYLLLGVMVLTFLNHRDFAPEAAALRGSSCERIAEDIGLDHAARERLARNLAAMEVPVHRIGEDPPLSQKTNIDTPYLDMAKDVILESGRDNAKFQEFRTLYHQLMLPGVMRTIFPPGMMGLFALLMMLMMVSTDNSRIYSSALTLAQDVVLPLRRKAFTPGRHVQMIRLVSVGVGGMFFVGSYYMAQLDYINMFTTIMSSLWLGGCGPVMIFGLYSRFGTTAGAYASLISGMGLSLLGILAQRNWAGAIHPWLVDRDLAEPLGRFLETVSSPFHPYVKWEMDPTKFPVNSFEIFFLTMLATLAIYIVVSLLTRRRPFNLDRMLHRGKYDLDGQHGEVGGEAPSARRGLWRKVLGITPEYTRGDRIIAWSAFLYSFVYAFLAAFVFVAVYNHFSPWPLAWWSRYFLIVSLVVPGIVAVISTVWFTIGGIVDLLRLFRDLKQRVADPLDDGRVEGNMSLADKAALEEVDRKSQSNGGGKSGLQDRP